jgi:hypothetical protein
MAIFDQKSRYVRYATVVHAVDRRGRTAACLTPAVVPKVAELGRHRLKQGQRLDHLAAHYLGDANGYWQIADIENAMTVEAALDADLVVIPVKR